MSSFYELHLQVTDLTVKNVQDVMSAGGWTEEQCEEGEIDGVKFVAWDGTGSLFAGQTEAEAHDILEQNFRKINPQARLETHWLCRDDLPWDTYGSIEEEDSEDDEVLEDEESEGGGI